MLELSGELATGFCGAKPVDDINGGGKENAMAAQAGCIAQRDGQVAFSGSCRAGKDNVGAGVDEVQLQKVVDLHAVDLGGPVPIPSGHSFSDREAGVMVTAAVASGLFGGLYMTPRTEG